MIDFKKSPKIYPTQHLDPEYLEDRESEHRDADSFQLSCNIIKKTPQK